MYCRSYKSLREGQTATSVAAAFGLNGRTVFTWLAKFSDSGEDALLAKPVPGRHPKVNDEEKRWIAQAVREHTPQQFGFDYALWTLSLIAQLINRQFGKSLSLAPKNRNEETACGENRQAGQCTTRRMGGCYRRPVGFENSVTAGVVSPKGRLMPNEIYVPFIQTDVGVNPGNSGGQLFNMNGEVVGINSMINSQTGGYMGLAFATPIGIAFNVAEQLRSQGKVSRSRIGVQA